jgi:hypothetical protein
VRSNQLILIKFFQLTKNEKKNGYLGQKKQTKKKKKNEGMWISHRREKKEKIKKSISTGGGGRGEFSTGLEAAVCSTVRRSPRFKILLTSWRKYTFFKKLNYLTLSG